MKYKIYYTVTHGTLNNKRMHHLVDLNYYDRAPRNQTVGDRGMSQRHLLKGNVKHQSHRAMNALSNHSPTATSTHNIWGNSEGGSFSQVSRKIMYNVCRALELTKWPSYQSLKSNNMFMMIEPTTKSDVMDYKTIVHTYVLLNYL